MRGDTLFSSGKTQLFSRRRLDVDVLNRNTEVGGDSGNHLRQIRRNTRGLGNDSAIHIRDFPATPSERLSDLAQQHAALDVLVLRVGVGEMPADVAQPGGAEAGIANS